MKRILILLVSFYLCLPVSAQETGLEQGDYQVSYSHIKDFHLWQPISKFSFLTKGDKLTLADMKADKLLRKLDLKQSDLLDIELQAVSTKHSIRSQKPLIIVPGGYYNQAVLAIAAEYVASYGFQILYIKLKNTEPEKSYSEISYKLDKVSTLVNGAKSIYLWGFHSGSGLSMMMANRMKAKGVISIEGSETWKNSKAGWPVLKPLLAKTKVRVPIHRIRSFNNKPEWYPSAPRNTVESFYKNYKAPVVETKLSDKIQHDELSDLAFWFNWEPKLKQLGSEFGVMEYRQMLKAILTQLLSWEGRED